VTVTLQVTEGDPPYMNDRLDRPPDRPIVLRPPYPDKPIAAETELFTCVDVGLQAALACLLQIYKEQLQSFVV
jgi:hypothetical protein